MNRRWVVGCACVILSYAPLCGMEQASDDKERSSHEFGAAPLAVAHARRNSNRKAVRSCKCECVCACSSRFQVGGNYTHVKIRPHGFHSFRGNLGGAQGLYEFRPKNNFYAGAKLAWRDGKTTGSAGKRTFIYIDSQERLGVTCGGYDIDWRLAFFSGIGYRYLRHTFTAKPTSVVTSASKPLKFRYNEIYLPAGLITDFGINDWFGIGFSGTWMPQIYPTVKIVPLGGAHWILSHTLTNFSVEMPFTFTLTRSRKHFLILNPTYEHWRDGHSTAKAASGVALGIPGNSYNFWGVDLNYAYAF